MGIRLDKRGEFTMSEDETNQDETTESQKLSSKDKQEIQEGLCVNCAVVMFIIMIMALTALVL
jgi:hypothetical protein